jgi:hypothetical protein
MIYGYRQDARIRTWTIRDDVIPHKEHILPVDCGCVVHVDADWSGHIVQCHLHHAAPELLEAAKSALPRLPSGETAAKLEVAIGKAEGR